MGAVGGDWDGDGEGRDVGNGGNDGDGKRYVLDRDPVPCMLYKVLALLFLLWRC